MPDALENSLNSLETVNSGVFRAAESKFDSDIFEPSF